MDQGHPGHRLQDSVNALDLRRWLAEVEALGEMRLVRGADWNLELGAISELNVKKEVPPALLFDEIRGYPPGFRVLTCSTSSPARLSSILRLGVERTHQGLVEKLRGKPAQWQAKAKDFPPVVVKSGPALEHVQKTVDVLAFPAPFWHELDEETRRQGLAALAADLRSGALERRVMESFKLAATVGHGTVFAAWP
jgi:hypothetical protein